MKHFSRRYREGCWILGCFAVAIYLCYVAPDYGYAPVPSFTLILYLLTGVFRVFFGLLFKLWLWLQPPWNWKRKNLQI